MKKIFTLLLLTFSLVTSAKTEGLNEAKTVVCPTVAIAYAGNSFCTSDALQAVVLTGTEAYLGGTFTSTPGLFINSATGEIAPYISTPGTYIITYSIPPNGPCPETVATTIVTIDGMPSMTLTSAASTANQTVCPNAPIMNITYSVTNASVTVTGLPPGVTGTYAAGIFTISGVPTAIGTFNYTVTTNGGGTCPSASTTGTITVGAPTVTVNAPSICQGDFVTITATPGSPGAYTYVWTTPAGVVNPGNVASFVTSVPGAYSVIITSAGCASATATGVVSVNSIPVVTGSPTSETICSGSTTNIVLSSNVPNTTFTWTVMPNGVSGASSGSGNTINQTLVATGINMGIVTYIITPIANGCFGTSITISVTVNPVPEIFSAPTSTVVCSGETASISIMSSTPNISYTWTVVENGATGAMSGSSNSNPLYINQPLYTTGNTTGTVIYLIMPISNGCSGAPVSITFNVHPLPEPNIVSGSICTDALGNVLTSYLLDTGLNPAYHTFEWYLDGVLTPETGGAFLATSSGNYWVNVTNTVTGCFISRDTTVVSSEIPQSMTVTQTEQGDGNYTLTANVVGNGTYQFQYLLDGTTIQSSNIFTDVPFGLHTVEAFESCGNLMVQVDLPEIVTQDLTVSPNPVTDVLTLRNGNTINRITVFNQVGQTVFEQEYNSKTVQVDLSALNAGIYFISMDANTNQKTKIIKN